MCTNALNILPVGGVQEANQERKTVSTRGRTSGTRVACSSARSGASGGWMLSRVLKQSSSTRQESNMKGSLKSLTLLAALATATSLAIAQTSGGTSGSS